MAAPDTPAAVKEHLLHDTDSSERKPHLALADETPRYGHLHPGNNDGPAVLAQQPRKRYWARTLVLIFIPSIVTAWYGIIWIALVLGVDNDEAVKFRTFSGSLIFYSWFIIGVFGLSWSQYGLAGVEVAMLEDKFWRAPNLVALLSHSNATWSSPSGWVKVLYHRQFNRLWCLLMLLTFLPFVAFPLSGLVFEIADGYIEVNKAPWVMGKNQSTFNENYLYDWDNSIKAWTAGSTPTVPGYGVVYTPNDGSIDRDNHSCLKRTPNTMPLVEGIPDMFLAPQADQPVSGKAWGLRVRYDCSMVRKVSEFTILSQKAESSISGVHAYEANSPERYVDLTTPGGERIHVFNSSAKPGDLNLNVWAYSELGLSHPNRERDQYNGTHPDFVGEGEAGAMVMELALWQLQFSTHYDQALDDLGASFPFNRTLEPVIEGMPSPYTLDEDGVLVANRDFFRIRGDGSNGTITDLQELFLPADLIEYSKAALHVGAPIGLRCLVSSGPGTAELDGVTSTFSDFERVDPAWQLLENGGRPEAGLRLFGHIPHGLLIGRFFEHYRAAHLPGEVPDVNTSKYQGYIYPRALLESVMLAYGMNALELMYDIVPNPDRKWIAETLKASREGKILGIASLIPGSGMGYFVLALFCLWSGTSVVLGLVYGFRERGSDKLDGYSMFRRGAEMSDEIRDSGGVMSREDSFYKNQTFQAMPGT